jgi:hypothetical protein
MVAIGACHFERPSLAVRRAGRARPFDKTLEQPKRIDPARGSKPTELDQIDSSLPIFDLRDPAMGNAKARGQVALRKPRVTADSAEFRT